MDTEIRDLEKKIFSTFAEVASSIGYSPMHGQIIGALTVRGKTLCLQDIAEATGYSVSMISLSLDLLEVLGIIKKIKKVGDRKLYVEFSGDLLEALKSAILLKLSKSINTSLEGFEEGKKKLEGRKDKESVQVLKSIGTLETDIRRLKRYVDLLSKTRLP
ncbi:MAG: hypothetical protein IH899_21505 [Planctomycetes bacterium]|nr:hypothetical protein [Planctomycetota bacterium]